ncbi:MAG: putative toxin-antitoxin system toxin component, PIN family [Bacteroidales bacterium]|nr:putative toxin-antitoxin system toxin component, PIN family [Bacteroidales bacterium]
MSVPIYAVIDTNVIVAALLTKNPFSPTRQILYKIDENVLIPVLNHEIFQEYQEVLTRTKLKLPPNLVTVYLQQIATKGLHMKATPYGGTLPDPKDRVFYEVSLTGDSYLVTGNQKHFPVTPKVVTPAQMIELISHR